MTTYEINSEYCGGYVNHKFYLNGKETPVMEDIKEFADIADANREEIFKLKVKKINKIIEN